MKLNKNEKNLYRRWYNKIKAVNVLGGKCVGCGTKDIRYLTFHHLDSTIKETQISFLTAGSWDKIQDELTKCIVYCHNCHLEYHFNEESKYGSGCRTSKKTFIEYKGGECKKCGYNKCQAALSFHHLDKSTKLFEISSNTKIFRSILDINKEIKTELDKCDILCMNCHLSEDIRQDILDYVLANYNNIEIRKISKKVDRDIVYDMFFNKGMKQFEITKELGVKKSTLSMIIKELKISKKIL